MLEIHDLSTGYGESQILFNVSISVPETGIVSLVGSNAAGKSTLINTISGINKVWSGSISFFGEDITHTPPDVRVSKGLIQVPEGRHLFPELTIKENLQLGSFSKQSRNNREKNLERVYTMFPRLLERETQLAGSLSGGEQQMCAIARAIMANPRLLILDEPSLGLAPILVEKVFEIIADIQKQGVTILLVEQNVGQALSMANKGYVLESGRVVMEGKGTDLLTNDDLRKAYLGI